MQMAAVASAVMGIYALALPHTPPKGAGVKVTFRSALGLDALVLLKDRSFAIFALGSFLICIPLQFYYAFTNPFLSEVGMPEPAAKMTMGQMSELVFMLVMPWMLVRFGVKKMLLMGMAAWTARYVLFAMGDNGTLVWMLYAGHHPARHLLRLLLRDGPDLRGPAGRHQDPRRGAGIHDVPDVRRRHVHRRVDVGPCRRDVHDDGGRRRGHTWLAEHLGRAGRWARPSCWRCSRWRSGRVSS